LVEQCLGVFTDRRFLDGIDNQNVRECSTTAGREQHIIALRLRGVPFHEIGRVIGITRQSAFRAFHKALRRATDQDIKTHHRSELAELEMEKANDWRTMDANKDDWKVQMSGTAQLRGSHVRSAKLLGLDAPTKLDVRGLYRSGPDEMSDEQLDNERHLAGVAARRTSPHL
jgi:hypothetical protein